MMVGTGTVMPAIFLSQYRTNNPLVQCFGSGLDPDANGLADSAPNHDPGRLKLSLKNETMKKIHVCRVLCWVKASLVA
jgi:hypothetical protein